MASAPDPSQPVGAVPSVTPGIAADAAPGASRPAGPDVITLGRRIRHFRTERSLTLDGLSAVVGTAPSRLSLIENGHREPRLSLLRSIAEALEVPLADLLSAEPPSRRAAL